MNDSAPATDAGDYRQHHRDRTPAAGGGRDPRLRRPRANCRLLASGPGLRQASRQRTSLHHAVRRRRQQSHAQPPDHPAGARTQGCEAARPPRPVHRRHGHRSRPPRGTRRHRAGARQRPTPTQTATSVSVRPSWPTPKAPSSASSPAEQLAGDDLGPATLNRQAAAKRQVVCGALTAA